MLVDKSEQSEVYLKGIFSKKISIFSVVWRIINFLLLPCRPINRNTIRSFLSSSDQSLISIYQTVTEKSILSIWTPINLNYLIPLKKQIVLAFSKNQNLSQMFICLDQMVTNITNIEPMIQIYIDVIVISPQDSILVDKRKDALFFISLFYLFEFLYDI